MDRDGLVVEVPNPAYRPFVSFCEIPGCDCETDGRWDAVEPGHRGRGLLR